MKNLYASWRSSLFAVNVIAMSPAQKACDPFLCASSNSNEICSEAMLCSQRCFTICYSLQLPNSLQSLLQAATIPVLQDTSSLFLSSSLDEMGFCLEVLKYIWMGKLCAAQQK